MHARQRESGVPDETGFKHEAVSGGGGERARVVKLGRVVHDRDETLALRTTPPDNQDARSSKYD